MSDQRLLAQANRFFVAAILVALTVWPVAFAIGAYGQVFCSLLLQIWVVSAGCADRMSGRALQQPDRHLRGFRDRR